MRLVPGVGALIGLADCYKLDGYLNKPRKASWGANIGRHLWLKIWSATHSAATGC